MRILLVQPAPFENGRLGLENALWLSEPAALTALAAMVAEKHEVRLVDMRLEEADALPRIVGEFRPELVGVTCMTTDAYQACAVAYCAKSMLGSDVFTVVGGHHPTLAPEEHDHECIDAVCVGEGEETLLELVEHLDLVIAVDVFHVRRPLGLQDAQSDRWIRSFVEQQSGKQSGLLDDEVQAAGAQSDGGTARPAAKAAQQVPERLGRRRQTRPEHRHRRAALRRYASRTHRAHRRRGDVRETRRRRRR